jgi:hypothetical protein
METKDFCECGAPDDYKCPQKLEEGKCALLVVECEHKIEEKKNVK